MHLCHDLDIVINWEKLDLEPKQQANSLHSDKHIGGENLPPKLSDHQFHGDRTVPVFLSASPSTLAADH